MNFVKLSIWGMLLCFSWSFTNAQKVSIAKKSSTAHLRGLPVQQLPKTYQFYSTIISANPEQLRGLGITESELRGMIDIGGFMAIGKGGHFQVEYIIDKASSDQYKASIESTTTTSKDDEGTETSTTYYHWEYTYAMPMAIKVTGMDGTVIIDKILSGTGTPQKVESKRSESSASVKVDRDKNATQAILASKKAYVLSQLTVAVQYMNKQIGFPDLEEHVSLNYIKKKKHPEYQSYFEAFEMAKEGLALLTAEGGVEEAKSMLSSPIEFWLEKQKDLSIKEKEQAKLKKACLDNLKEVHLALDNFDEAIAYSSQAVPLAKNGSKHHAKYESYVLGLKSQMEMLGLESRHFAFEFGDPTEVVNNTFLAEKGAKVDAYQREAMGVSVYTKQYEGYVVDADGTKRTVTFVIDRSKDKGLSFDEGGNVEFFEVTENAVNKEYPSTVTMDEFGFDGRVFKAMKYKPASAIALSKTDREEFLEVLFETEKVAVYHFYPNYQNASQLGELRDEIAIWKAGAEKIQSLEGLKFFSLDKGLTKYFSDCAEIVQEIKDGNITKSDKSIVGLAQKYETSCIMSQQ